MLKLKYISTVKHTDAVENQVDQEQNGKARSRKTFLEIALKKQ